MDELGSASLDLQRCRSWDLFRRKPFLIPPWHRLLELFEDQFTPDNHLSLSSNLLLKPLSEGYLSIYCNKYAFYLNPFFWFIIKLNYWSLTMDHIYLRLGMTLTKLKLVVSSKLSYQRCICDAVPNIIVALFKRRIKRRIQVLLIAAQTMKKSGAQYLIYLQLPLHLSVIEYDPFRDCLCSLHFATGPHRNLGLQIPWCLGCSG